MEYPTGEELDTNQSGYTYWRYQYYRPRHNLPIATFKTWKFESVAGNSGFTTWLSRPCRRQRQRHQLRAQTRPLGCKSYQTARNAWQMPFAKYDRIGRKTPPPLERSPNSLRPRVKLAFIGTTHLESNYDNKLIRPHWRPRERCNPRSSNQRRFSTTLLYHLTTQLLGFQDPTGSSTPRRWKRVKLRSGEPS